MNRNEIIRMAREAGLSNEIGAFGYPYLPELERFAAIVAAHEREACAKVCDVEVAQINLTSGSRAELVARMVAGICAAAIRARGEVPR